MKYKKTRGLIALLLCLICTAGMLITNPIDTAAAKNKKLVVGTNAEFPPFEYIDNDGEVAGFDMALMEAVGNAMGYDVEFINMEFKSLIGSIQTGGIDACIAGMTVTEERSQSVDFTDSYYKAVQHIITLKDSDIKEFADLNGKKVAVQEGTTGDILVTPGEDNTVITDESTVVKRFKKGTDAVLDLKNGAVDAVVIDANPAEEFVKANKNKLVSFADNTSVEDYAIAVSKDKPELLKDLNEGLKKIKENGTYDKLVAEYIGGSYTEPVESKGTLTVGTNAEFPPFEYINDDGEIDGFDVALIKAIGKRAGYDVKMVNMEFKSLIGSIQTGGLDASIAGMTVTEERKLSVNFTDSYYEAVQYIIVRKDSDITQLSDLNGKKIAVQEGTTGDILVTPGEDNTVITDTATEVKRFKKGTDAVLDLKNGAVDAVVIDANPAQEFVKANPDDLKCIPDDTSIEYYAIAINKEKTDILADLNKALQEIKEDGTYDELVDTYINQKEDAADDAAAEESNWFVSFAAKCKRIFIDTNGYKLLLDGLKTTLILTVASVTVGIVLGFVIALLKLSEVRKGHKTLASRVAGLYIDILRGTPVIVQLMIIYMVLFRNQMGIIAAIVTFGINSSAYVAEIVRAGIMAVDHGQMEGGRSLGFSYGQTMRYIIVPQAIKNILPALCNEFIALLKETSVVGYVAIQDLTKASDFIISRTYETFLPLLAIAVIYYIIVKVLSKLFGVLERRLRQSDIR